MRILVTDGDNRAALAVTRALGRRGHHVVVADRRSPALAQMSRYCAGRATYPDPAIDADGFVAALLDTVRAESIDVLLPVADITTTLVTENRARFEALCRLPVASAEAVTRAADKVEIMRTATRLGVPIPATVYLEAGEDPVARAAGLSWPLVIKPRRSRLRTAAGWLSCTVSYASTPDELRRQVAAVPAEGFPLILQERIEGPGLGVFMCYKRGALVAVFSHRRLREKPPSGGVSVLSESVPVRQDAREYAQRLLDDLGWQGIAMVEFKVDSRDDVPRLMEINGRFWGSLQLAIDSGIDFPSILLETLTEAPPAAVPSYRFGVRNRWLWGDFDALLLQLFSTRGSAPGRGRLTAIVDFLRLWQPALHYENPKWSDLGPWWYESRQWLRAAVAGVSPRRGSTR
jgi:predicted ATP-grasp superfamily ATP-dependent carboligase